MSEGYVCVICKTVHPYYTKKVLCEVNCMKELQWRIEKGESDCTMYNETLEEFIVRKKKLEEKISKVKYWIRETSGSLCADRSAKMSYLRSFYPELDGKQTTFIRDSEKDYWIVYYTLPESEHPIVDFEYAEDEEEYNERLDRIALSSYPKDRNLRNISWAIIDFSEIPKKDYEEFPIRFNGKSMTIRLVKPKKKGENYFFCCKTDVLGSIIE